MVEQSTSWEADGHSASQEILRLLWNPSTCSQDPTTGPYPDPNEPISTFSPCFPDILSKKKLYPFLLYPPYKILASEIINIKIVLIFIIPLIFR